MWRFLAGGGAMLLMMTAGMFIWTGMAQDEDDPVPDAPEAAEEALGDVRPAAPSAFGRRAHQGAAPLRPRRP